MLLPPPRMATTARERSGSHSKLSTLPPPPGTLLGKSLTGRRRGLRGQLLQARAQVTLLGLQQACRKCRACPPGTTVSPSQGTGSEAVGLVPSRGQHHRARFPEQEQGLPMALASPVRFAWRGLRTEASSQTAREAGEGLLHPQQKGVCLLGTPALRPRGLPRPFSPGGARPPARWEPGSELLLVVERGRSVLVLQPPLDLSRTQGATADGRNGLTSFICTG